MSEKSDEVELKEMSRNSESTKQSVQGSLQSSSAMDPVIGRVGLQVSSMLHNSAPFEEVNPTKQSKTHCIKGKQIYVPRIEIKKTSKVIKLG